MPTTERPEIVGVYKFFHVVARAQSPHRKTRVYDLISNHGTPIAIIEFYPSWRQHVLSAMPEVVWSAGCLEDVIHFLEKVKSEREQKRLEDKP